MDKIYFEIQKSNGEFEKMQLLLKFQLEQFNKNYILYKDCDDFNPHYYAASYEDEENNGFSNLNTNFTDKEKEILNEIFNKIKKGEFENA